MGAEPSSLRLEPIAYALRLDEVRHPGGLLRSGAEPEPDDPRHRPALECSELRELEVERAWLGSGDALGDCFRDRDIDLAEEPDRQMQVRRRRPAEGARDPLACGHVVGEGPTMLLGQGQPEERSYLQRPARIPGFFAQWTGAQELGAVGRQPNCELTESMPAARLSAWIMRTSSAVIGGFVDTASMAVAGIASNGTGSLSFVFLIPRACRNQSKMVS